MMRMHFRKLQVWQKGVDLVKHVYRITTVFPKEELFGLTSQMRRSAVSIPSNIAEGSQRTSDNEYGHFVLVSEFQSFYPFAHVPLTRSLPLRGERSSGHAYFIIAKGSLAELETQAFIARELTYTTQEEYDVLLLKISELDRMLFSFHATLTT